MTHDMGDEDMMHKYELLLDNTDEAKLLDENNFEINTESQDRLQGTEQEDPTLRNKRKLEAQVGTRTSGEEQVDGLSPYQRTVVPTNKKLLSSIVVT